MCCNSDGVRCVPEPAVASDCKLHQPTAAGFDGTRDRICRVDHLPDEAHIRALLLQSLATSGLVLRNLDSSDLNGSARVVVTAFVTAHQRVDDEVEKIV